MSHRIWILTSLATLAAVSTAVADDFPKYMMPPDGVRATPIEQLEKLAESIARIERPAAPPIVPVEAPRPAPPVEIVTTPVGAINISCSFVPTTLEPLIPEATSSQAVAVVMEPVEAVRPR